MSAGETKPCVVCGREIQWRKKWERDWEQVKYCSKACRSRGVSDDDSGIERVIVSLLQKQAAGKTICPSEAAREVDPDGWRERMEDVRMAARRLVEAGRLEITQGGKVVEPSRAKGAVRLRLVR